MHFFVRIRQSLRHDYQGKEKNIARNDADAQTFHSRKYFKEKIITLTLYLYFIASSFDQSIQEKYEMNRSNTHG